MKVFADTAYWIALISPGDQLNRKATQVTKTLTNAQFFTTDEILIELLTFCAGRGAAMRAAGTKAVRAILTDPALIVLPQSRKTFLNGVKLYEQRQDKKYSLTDCISMNAMKEKRVKHILTGDGHFTQEGFTTLL